MAMTSKDETHHSYGVELPSFTFDYSEYFVSATITRQRYLTMVLIGHRIIYEDYPIEAISTEYENMEHWNQATKFWSKPVKYNVRSKLQQMFCVIQNRHNRSSTPYQVPATWLRISSKALNETGMHSNYNRHIEMLRCPLHHFPKQTDNFYIDVDVYRKENGAQATKTLLISFAVSSQKSYVGYPNVPNFQASSIASWTGSKPDSAIAVSEITVHRKSVTLIACIPGVRIAHIKRSETGLSMLLEFLAHLFHHGVDQVILGFVAPVTSPYFISAQTLLQKLFPRNAVILIPTAVPQFEDVPGLPGLQFSDNFADVFFLNHCLYLLKGKDHAHSASGNTGPKFMLVIRVNQLLLSAKKSGTLKHLLTASLEEKWAYEVQTSPSVTGVFLGAANHHSSSSANHHKGKSSPEKGNKPRHKGEKKSSKSDSQVRRYLTEDSLGRSSLSRLCSIRIQPSSMKSGNLSSNAQYHFVSDPMTVFHDNGPGHYTYMKDFFKDSVPRTLKPSFQALFPWLVTLINIDKAIAIDVHSTEELLQQYSGSSASTSAANNKNSAVHSDLPASHAIVYPVCVSPSSLPFVIEHGVLNASVLQVNTYVPPSYPSDTLQDLPSQGPGTGSSAPSEPVVSLESVQDLTKDIYEKLHAELAAVCNRTAAAVQAESDTSDGKNRAALAPPTCRDASFVQQVWKQVQDQLDQQQQEKLTFSLSEHVDAASAAHKSRKDISPPFWQLCNTAHLSEILRKVFYSV
jgi:hypothetical protein